MSDDKSELQTVVLDELGRADRARRSSLKVLKEVSAKVIPDITSHDFKSAFESAHELRPRVRKVQIFGLSSYRIQPEVEAQWGTSGIEEMELLLVNARCYVKGSTDDFVHESRLAVCWNWLGMVKRGLIRRVTVRQYDFYPTEWFVIFDEELVIFGDYEFDVESIARARTKRTVLLARNHGAGSVMVQSFVSKFGALFDACGHDFGEDEFCGVIEEGMDLHHGHWPHSASRAPEKAPRLEAPKLSSG
jgi:hypothetical protein